MALNNVPLTGQSLGITKTPINQNFATINAAFAIDHVEMTPPGTAAPQGFHNKITLPPQSATPGPGFGANNGIYALNSALTGITETFWHSQSSNGPFDFPVTANIFSTTSVPAPAGTVGQGWCYLPAGLIMKWGTFATSNVAFVFPTGANIPEFTTAILSLQLTMGNTAAVPGSPQSVIYEQGTLSATGFDYFAFNTTANSKIIYTAIGY